MEEIIRKRSLDVIMCNYNKPKVLRTCRTIDRFWLHKNFFIIVWWFLSAFSTIRKSLFSNKRYHRELNLRTANNVHCIMPIPINQNNTLISITWCYPSLHKYRAKTITNHSQRTLGHYKKKLGKQRNKLISIHLYYY